MSSMQYLVIRKADPPERLSALQVGENDRYVTPFAFLSAMHVNENSNGKERTWCWALEVAL